MTRSVRWQACAAALWCVPLALRGQTPADTTKPYPLPPLTVSVTRAELPLSKVPLSVHTVGHLQISRAQPTWGLDEALANVPGVFVANRYNFSQDQRISIRGFGARSAFAVRGIKILVDGIPQTLPDGQGQLTNLELGEVDRIEIGELALSVGKRLRDAVHENLDPAHGERRPRAEAANRDPL